MDEQISNYSLPVAQSQLITYKCQLTDVADDVHQFFFLIYIIYIIIGCDFLLFCRYQFYAGGNCLSPIVTSIASTPTGSVDFSVDQVQHTAPCLFDLSVQGKVKQSMMIGESLIRIYGWESVLCSEPDQWRVFQHLTREIPMERNQQFIIVCDKSHPYCRWST